MIVCLYGKSAAPFVEPLARDLVAAAARSRAEVAALTIEAALSDPGRWRDVRRLYVLPFEVPLDLPASLPAAPAALLRTLFPGAGIVNNLAVHELCFDKINCTKRLLERGLPLPTTLLTSDPREAREFVAAYGNAVLKEPRSCGGHGHVVLSAAGDGTIIGESAGRRYVVELRASGVGRTLAHGVLEVPPPFFLQRLVAEVGRGGKLMPAQILRAYLVDGRILFWTERYRERYRRPSDFIVNVSFGARYRFLPAVNEEVRKLAMRAAEVLDVRIGAVDIIRTFGGEASVLEVDTDGHLMIIDRSFKLLPEYRSIHDFDRFIADALTAPTAETVTLVKRERDPGETRTARKPRPRPK
jgi:hypothetical protein